MKNYIFLFFLCVTSITFSQSSARVDKSLYKINALTPGVSYETGIGKDMTINLDALLVIAGGSRGPKDFNIGFFPGIDAEFRYFLNIDRRISKGKNIMENTANYVALNTGYQFGKPIIGTYELDNTSSIHLGLVYGWQRTYKKGFYWNLSFGPGVFF